MTEPRSRGSAPLEFVGVSALIAAVALAVMQFAVVAHVKAIVIDSAMAGAAFGSLADSSLAAGVERAEQLVSIGVAADLIDSVSGRIASVAGRPVTVVTVTYRVPAFALWIPAVSDRVSARAFIEQP